MPLLYDNFDVGIWEHQLLVEITVLIKNVRDRDVPILKKVKCAVIVGADTIFHSNKPRR